MLVIVYVNIYVYERLAHVLKWGYYHLLSGLWKLGTVDAAVMKGNEG